MSALEVLIKHQQKDLESLRKRRKILGERIDILADRIARNNKLLSAEHVLITGSGEKFSNAWDTVK